MSAKAERAFAGLEGRASVLMDGLRCQYSLVAVAYEYALVRGEGSMGLMGVDDDGGEVQLQLGSPPTALILEDHVTWWLGVNKEMSMFRLRLQ